MPVTWMKEQRERSASQSLSLFAVAVDGRKNKTGTLGRMEYSGCVPDNVAVEIFQAVQRIVETHKRRRSK